MIVPSTDGKYCFRNQDYRILSQILNSSEGKNMCFCRVMMVIRALGPILKHFNMADSEFHFLKGSLALYQCALVLLTANPFNPECCLLPRPWPLLGNTKEQCSIFINFVHWALEGSISLLLRFNTWLLQNAEFYLEGFVVWKSSVICSEIRHFLIDLQRRWNGSMTLTNNP